MPSDSLVLYAALGLATVVAVAGIVEWIVIATRASRLRRRAERRRDLLAQWRRSDRAHWDRPRSAS